MSGLEIIKGTAWMPDEPPAYLRRATEAECIAEIERLRKNNAFLEELFAMALDRQYSSELIGITVRNYLSTVEQAKDKNDA